MGKFPKFRLSSLKFLQLVLACACLGLHFYGRHFIDMRANSVILGTFVGYVIILIGLNAGYMLSLPSSKFMDIFYSTCGCALFATSGVLTIDVSIRDRRIDAISERIFYIAMVKGSLAILNSFLFIPDAVIVFRSK